MKLQFKIALVIGLTALFAACQKEDLPGVDGCATHDQTNGSNMRVGGPETGTSGGGGSLGDGSGKVAVDSLNIVSGGDDDRDGGGVVSGGDDDRDGGRRMSDEPKKK